MKGAPRSEIFNDVYFSPRDGLGESRYVFLAANGLPGAWAGRARFTIAETGFGTGLNLLAAWSLFEQTAAKGQKLEFISFEKFPLDKRQILEFLRPWREEFPAMLDRLVECYPDNPVGTHVLNLSADVTLTLIFEDVNTAIPKMETPVDCWFLDGFKPSVNPDMWSDVLFSNMIRLSVTGATFATFTAVGDVKRALMAAGFTVKRIKGYGWKYHMLTGVKP